MDVINSVFLLNSTYNKEKIKKIFLQCLKEYDICEFYLRSNIINLNKEDSFINKKISIDNGDYKCDFYVDKYSTEKERDIKLIIASFLVAIENSEVYNTVINAAYCNYLTYQSLLEDINFFKNNYERYDIPFCLMKVQSKNKSYAVKKIRELIRYTDKVYVKDEKDDSIYILFSNLNINDGEKIANKIQNNIRNVKVGVAEWLNSYVIMDLFGEVDNYIYMKSAVHFSNNESLSNKINKIFDKSILSGDNIYVVSGNEEVNNSICEFSFEYDSNQYIVLKNPSEDTVRKLKELNLFVYKHCNEELAQDLFARIKRNES